MRFPLPFIQKLDNLRGMDHLNYHHLLYFWVVAREGSVAGACERLHLAQPTISTQVHNLERALGAKLFRRAGRQLALTDTGQAVYHYAEQIFALGQELVNTVKGSPTGDQKIRVMVGIIDALPKLVAYHLLKPAFELEHPVHVVCIERDLKSLLAELALHRLDVVFCDSAASPAVPVRAFSHYLGECAVTIFGRPELARQYRRGFPRSLDGAPFLVPTDNTALRRSFDQWLERHKIKPSIQGEVEDSALTKVLGQAGLGLFLGSQALEKEIRRQYGVHIVGRLKEVRETYYAITVERRIKHPVVVALCEAARAELFPGEGGGGKSR